MNRVLILFLVALTLGAQTIVPSTLADVVGDGSSHKFTASKTTARWVQFVCLKGNTSVVRIGDANVSSSQGMECAPGGGLYLPPYSSPGALYDLSTWYYLAQTGDKVSILYGN